jgi:hypothetical protein
MFKRDSAVVPELDDGDEYRLRYDSILSTAATPVRPQTGVLHNQEEYKSSLPPMEMPAPPS